MDSQPIQPTTVQQQNLVHETLKRKLSNKKGRLRLTGKYVRVERTPSQIRNPAWVSIPVLTSPRNSSCLGDIRQASATQTRLLLYTWYGTRAWDASTADVPINRKRRRSHSVRAILYDMKNCAILQWPTSMINESSLSWSHVPCGKRAVPTPYLHE